MIELCPTPRQIAKEPMPNACWRESNDEADKRLSLSVWGDLKAHMGGGDHTLLETAESGEDAAKKAYKEALEDTETPSGVRAVLLRQQLHIQSSPDKVKALRGSKDTNRVALVR
jgi:hypothetical protein